MIKFICVLRLMFPSPSQYLLHLCQRRVLLHLHTYKFITWRECTSMLNTISDAKILSFIILQRKHSQTPDSALVSQHHLSSYGPLRPNVTSSIKPEIHNVSQCRQRRTEPQPQGICTKDCEARSSSSRDTLVDRQTHRQTDKVIAILRSPTRAE